jgi:hypothetical protein
LTLEFSACAVPKTLVFETHLLPNSKHRKL